MTFPSDLQHFSAGEFHRPEMMNEGFMRWLDRVRTLCGVEFHVTDDGRDAHDAPSGSSKTSLHYLGRAVDIRTYTLSAQQKWRIMAAVVALANDAPGAVEIEWVKGPTEEHLHLGVDEKAEWNEFIVNND